MVTNSATNTPTAAAGKVLQGAGVGVANAFSTATYPATAGTSGNVLTSDGTNWNSSAAAGNVSGPGSSTNRAIATWNGTGGTALFNNSTSIIDSTGRQTNTAQPVFAAYNSGTLSNVTGDGTTYTLILDSTYVNVGTSYSTSTGKFTAPVAGNYLFTCSFTASTATTWVVGGSVSNSAFYNRVQAIGLATVYMSEGTGNLTTNGSLTLSQVIKLAANDTIECLFTAYTTASAKNVSLTAGQAHFTGCLLC